MPPPKKRDYFIHFPTIDFQGTFVSLDIHPKCEAQWPKVGMYNVFRDGELILFGTVIFYMFLQPNQRRIKGEDGEQIQELCFFQSRVFSFMAWWWKTSACRISLVAGDLSSFSGGMIEQFGPAASPDA